MIRTWTVRAAAVLLAAMASSGCSGCKDSSASNPGPTAISGVKEVRAQVDVGQDGLTNEQRNIRDRYKVDSAPGATKHLYIVSVQTGDVLFYSTVKGKVTSSGKRLSPTSIVVGTTLSQYGSRVSGVPVNVSGTNYETSELIQDDGTYGSSIEYLYWFDANGVYRQLYVPATAMVLVSSEPVMVKKPNFSIELK